MIKSFISLVANDILRISGGDLKDYAIVFPNIRSGAIFRNELSGLLSGPAWSPGIFSIDDWLTHLSGFEKCSKLEELAILFPVICGHLPSITSFGDFIDLGETLLADFDDVDKYLADPYKLFTTLNEIKKIDSQFDITTDEELAERIRVFWSSFGTSRSSHQEKWLEIWEKLHPVYIDFQKTLVDRGMGTSGMCYRKAATDLASGRISTGRYKKIAFAGFNILTAAEELVFSHLRDEQAGLFYWDYHPSYLESPNEAGKFLKQYLRLFPPPRQFEVFPEGSHDFFSKTQTGQSITVVPVTSNTGQVQALLHDLSVRPAANRGIILSDEGLFSDLLTSWPDESIPVNFTSGYPLKDTQAAGLFSHLFQIYLEFSQSPDGSSCPSEALISFLRHPWAKWLTGDSSQSLVQLIQRRYPETVTREFIESDNRLATNIIHNRPAAFFLGKIRESAVRLRNYESMYNSIEKAAIMAISDQAEVFSEMIRKYGLVLDQRAISRLYSKFINSEKISLETDRDACNQVTGVLETRLVDYDEVFILSFNEGIWPSKSLPGSLIPYSMRKLFSLPTAESRDAMYAYYFYRLIQRTSCLNIYYITGHRDDKIRSGEKSRYITQLEYELNKEIVFRLEPPARVVDLSDRIVISKDAAVMDRLERYLAGHPAGKSLSPSAINEYLDCGLRFALKRIYDFKEPDEITYASDPRGFGTLIHQVMNRLYKDFEGTGTDPEDSWYQKVISDQEGLRKIILIEYQTLLKETAALWPGGKELLGLEVVRQFLTGILRFDRTSLPLEIIGLEQRFDMEFPVEINRQPCKVSLGGIIDRIDRTSEGIRIVDYKTGKCDLNAKSISELFNREAAKRPKEAFQVILYCGFYHHLHPTSGPVVPCLFRLGRFMAGDFDHRLTVGGNEIDFMQVANEFDAGLSIVLEELFNPGIPFVQTEDEQACRFCPFTGICSRESYS